MAIDIDTVRKVSSLARIKTTPEELAPLTEKLNGILAFIEQLDEVDTDGVEPLTSVISRNAPLRDDVVTEGGDARRVTLNAPKSLDGFFVVPKVVE